MFPIALVFGFLCLFQVSAFGQESVAPWYWVMADSIDASPVCPGRCLAVNDSLHPGEYENGEVGFIACKISSSDDSISDLSKSNNNQRWLYEGRDSPTFIRINASDAEPPLLLCLQPRPTPKSSHVSLTVAKCSTESNKNQTWIVANNSIASLAFDPPLHLAMSYKLSGDGIWRNASLVAQDDPGLRNRSWTKDFSMVEYADDLQLPQLNISRMRADSDNFIQNGGFENGSFDVSRNVGEREVDTGELFGVCHWDVVKAGVRLCDASSMPPAEGSRSLLLNDGIFSQKAQTRAGALYTLVLKMAIAKPDKSNTGVSSGNVCAGTDTLSVNPYPSTNVLVNLNSSSPTWEPRHIGFQAQGSEIKISFKGCAACGCYVDDVYLMQVTDPAPFSPPPPFLWVHPPLPPESSPRNKEPPHLPNENTSEAPPILSWELRSKSNRLSNGATAGILVGSSLLFFLIGAACFGVICIKKESKAVQEIPMLRPHEWSIQTTTPPRSDGRGESQPSISNAASAPAPASASAPVHPPHHTDPSPPSLSVATYSSSCP